VIVVHGDSRKPRTNLRAVLVAATNAHSSEPTAVIAPYFETVNDHAADGAPRWSNGGWKDGSNAVTPDTLSSFTVMDQMVAALADKTRFPALRWITLAGHSAGGQMVQRYAATGRAVSKPGLLINYVVANPSSYLYFTPERPDPSDPAGQRFTVPVTTCAYNDYKYGRANPTPYPYVAAVPASQMLTQFMGQRITYLLGADDTVAGSGPDSDALDTSCAAELQGAYRLQRGMLYERYLHTYFPKAQQNFILVPHVAHSNSDMFESAPGAAALVSRPSES